MNDPQNTYPLAIDKGGPIRRFTDSGIQGAVDHAISNLAKEGKNVAVLGVANQNIAGVAIMARIGNNWSIVAVGEKRWKGSGYKVQAAIKWSV